MFGKVGKRGKGEHGGVSQLVRKSTSQDKDQNVLFLCRS